jgi:pheromone a factor receptor
MGLAGIELCLGIPWSTYAALYLNIKNGINPWISWANVHANFYYVGQFPAFEWKANPIALTAIELSRWAPVICAFIFFAFFGFAQEARKHYRLAFNSVAKKVGYTTIAGFQSGSSSSFFSKSKGVTVSTIGRGTGTLPVYIRQETVAKRDSFASFSTNLTLGDVGGTLDDVKGPHSPTDSASSRNSHDEKRESIYSPPALVYTKPALDIDSTHRRSADAPMTARPDSATIV